MYEFSQQELAAISRLPKEYAELKDSFPLDIINAANFYYHPKLTSTDPIQLLEIYSCYEVGALENLCADIVVKDGDLLEYRPKPDNLNPLSISACVNNEWAFLEINGVEIFNRIEKANLPKVIVDAPTIFKVVLKMLRWNCG